MFDKCPSCGSKDIYIGASKLECGEHAACKNYTKKQAKIVTEKKLEKQMSFNLDFDLLEDTYNLW